tara:strand:+ start:145 stop:327 length:183 start_codon:yes stop_codon:yes gene_type:complete
LDAQVEVVPSFIQVFLLALEPVARDILDHVALAEVKLVSHDVLDRLDLTGAIVVPAYLSL